ncbi:hypothetical protein [Moritella viscosa]|uniref:Membrane protein n=1 Tax=Moritella viscosa TaxID=80854 RepID=A0ABY1HCJ5_9GAMM|nr:hypothetical protein [Moritella viscosa]SGY86589.1 Putative membrane protein [Moritella viscosa]SGY87958.1 Putative membrane protein [Moritella viscosa]SGY90395.1 Putative membrane protein [Moritella viscosa]SHO24988.1 Putative membrane protein [Moritella viscosa]
MLKKLLTVILGLCLLLYPFAVYLGLNYVSPFWLALGLLALLLSRLVMLRGILNKMPWLLPATTLGGLAIVTSLFTDSDIGFKLYPLMVNFAMLAVFAYSYLKPPTVIETFARLQDPNLPEHAVNYTRKVTLVWCGFFIINASISLYTALYSSFKVWTIYNGFIAYILIGSLCAVEFVVRLFVQRKHANNSEVISTNPSIATTQKEY